MLSYEKRLLFQQLCGALLPAWEKLPDGASLSLENDPIDRALNLRPELQTSLESVLGKLSDPINSTQLRLLEKDNPEQLKNVKLLVCATYFEHREVRTALQYHGQQALDIGRGEFGCEELVLEMLSGPKRYRKAH